LVRESCEDRLVVEESERDALRLVFDEDADAYDRTRPRCPDYVFDDIVELAKLRPGSRVVEVGCGTGQATVPLAERGLSVAAVEIGPRLADRARMNLARFPAVEVETTSFEDVEPGERRFDAVISVNAFHWVDPRVRFAKAAQLLGGRGHLVLVATPWVVPPGASSFWWEVQDDWAAVGAERVDPSAKHPDRVRDFSDDIAASGLFQNVEARRYLFEVTFSADDYATNLRTQSGLRELTPHARAELIDRVRERVMAHGGVVTAHLLATINVAAPSSPAVHVDPP
jgi:SAM-dependent methyltransferase